MSMPREAIYTDASICGHQPSALGGAWAFCHVFDIEENYFAAYSGLILPEEFGFEAVGNNFAEVYAAVKALEYLEDGWRGTFWTDSMWVLHLLRRGTERVSCKSLPKDIIERLEYQRQRHCRIKYELCGSHPTATELKFGINRKGKPVSKWNVKADEAAKEECSKLKANDNLQ